MNTSIYFKNHKYLIFVFLIVLFSFYMLCFFKQSYSLVLSDNTASEVSFDTLKVYYPNSDFVFLNNVENSSEKTVEITNNDKSSHVFSIMLGEIDGNYSTITVTIDGKDMKLDKSNGVILLSDISIKAEETLTYSVSFKSSNTSNSFSARLGVLSDDMKSKDITFANNGNSSDKSIQKTKVSVDSKYTSNYYAWSLSNKEIPEFKDVFNSGDYVLFNGKTIGKYYLWVKSCNNRNCILNVSDSFDIISLSDNSLNDYLYDTVKLTSYYKDKASITNENCKNGVINNKSGICSDVIDDSDISNYEKILNDNVTNAGINTRAGVVAAARFLAINFPYRVTYFSGSYPFKGLNLTSLNKKINNPASLEKKNYDFYNSIANFKFDLEYSNLTEDYLINTYNKDKDRYNAVTPLINWGYPIDSNNSNGLNCGGFVYWAFANGGFDLKRYGGNELLVGNSTEEMKTYGDLVSVKDAYNENSSNHYSSIKVGDLVYANNTTSAYHVGILIGKTDKYLYVAESTGGCDANNEYTNIRNDFCLQRGVGIEAFKIGETINSDELYLTSAYKTKHFDSFIKMDNIYKSDGNISNTFGNMNSNYKVNYIKKDNSVICSITSDFSVNKVDGFSLSNDNKTLTKEYDHNIYEEIQLKNTLGDVSLVNIKISDLNKNMKTDSQIVDVPNTAAFNSIIKTIFGIILILSGAFILYDGFIKKSSKD